jgi:ABC-type Fe3+/spermidine/putrescine transport system ATPase subunit
MPILEKAETPMLKLTGLCKRYDTVAVSDVCLTLGKGKILSLLGPSGCGKTTLLRLVAGLEHPDHGRVVLDGSDITKLQPHKRQIGMMFQEFALFPHKSVFENVAFGLQMQPLRQTQVMARTEKILSLVGLSQFSRRNVSDLSGGERQRVALARSLAPRPKLLMLDEPLGALDRALRERLLSEIHTILKNLEMTTIFVTHDQTEALTVGDRVAVMHQGAFVQLDTPEALYLHPNSSFVAEFLGYKNIWSGQVTGRGRVDTLLGPLPLPEGSFPAGRSVTVVIPADGVRLCREKSTNNPGRVLRGRVVSRIFTGQNYQIKVALDADRFITCALSNREIPPKAGEGIHVWLDPQRMIVIP